MSELRERTRMYIDGEWTDGNSEAPPLVVVDPSSEETLAEMPEAGAREAQAALEAAKRASRAWARVPAQKRASYLRKVSLLIKDRKEELATLVVREQGKTITEARGEVDSASEFFSYFAGLARGIEGEILPSDEPDEEVWIRRVPHGVVVALTAWNYPLALSARKIAPAIVAGNAVVIKPHEITPLSCLALMEIIEEAGVPKGVVNAVVGRGETVGSYLVKNPLTSLVTMTGGVEAGRAIMRDASANITTVSLELGGKAPFIVLDDASVDLAVENAVASRFMNCGQTCICNERTYVHSSVYDEFVEKFVRATENLKLGSPLEDSTEVGPKVSREELEKVESLVFSAVDGGAEALTGGKRPEGFEKGYWYEPTVLVGAGEDSEIMQREVFGPVVPVAKIEDLEEAVSLSNTSSYGLSAYLFTNDFGKIMHAINALDFGEVYINRAGPEAINGFHAGRGHSGVGGDDGKHGLESYLQKQTVYTNFSARNN